MTKRKRAAFYARSATDPGAAIAEQRQNVTAYCLMRGWPIVAEYVDAPASGATDDRPDFRRMVDDAMAGQFDAIVVESQLRLFRDAFLLELHRRKLEAAGVEIVSITNDGQNDIDFGQLVVLADKLAEREKSRQRSAQVRRGLAARKLRRGESS